MKKQEIRCTVLVNDEVGLGRNRSEITDTTLPGPNKEASLSIEEEVILEELGLGKNFSFVKNMEYDLSKNNSQNFTSQRPENVP